MNTFHRKNRLALSDICYKTIMSITIPIILTLIYSCGSSSPKPVFELSYSHPEPDYGKTQLVVSNDTITFYLDSLTYNSIKSSNYFSENGTEYISFFDNKSNSANLYNFSTRQLSRKIPLKSIIDKENVQKGTVLFKNTDSIYVFGRRNIYLLDGNGNIRNTINYEKESNSLVARYSNDKPVVFKGNTIITGKRPGSSMGDSLPILKEFEILFRFDVSGKRVESMYNLPPIYQDRIYGHYFIDYSYCVNDRGNLVFSFPVDTSIYESDLEKYIHGYFGRSNMQKGDIPAASPLKINKIDEKYKNYLVRDAYGSIFFDSKNQRYLRVATLAMSEEDYNNNIRSKKQRIILFDKNFKIIGESSIDENIVLSSLFITDDGRIYARVLPRDEYAIHYVRLEYQENTKTDLL